MDLSTQLFITLHRILKIVKHKNDTFANAKKPLLWGLVCRNFMPLLKLFVYSYIRTSWIRIFVLASCPHFQVFSTRWTFLTRLTQLSSINKNEISTLVGLGAATGIYGTPET